MLTGYCTTIDDFHISDVVFDLGDSLHKNERFHVRRSSAHSHGIIIRRYTYPPKRMYYARCFTWTSTSKCSLKVGPANVCFEDEFVIGEGCSTTCVYSGLLEDGTEVAVKRMVIYSYKKLAENEERVLTLLEVENSKHIVNCRHFERGNLFTFLILDLCEETSVDHAESHSKEYLEQYGPIMIREILTGLKVLHCGKQKLVHMSLKPSNVLVDIHGHMRLADFGISRVLGEDEITVQTGTKELKVG